MATQNPAEAITLDFEGARITIEGVRVPSVDLPNWFRILANCMERMHAQDPRAAGRPKR